VKKQSKTTAIRTLLIQGKTVADVAKKLKVKPAAVYQVRYRMRKEEQEAREIDGVFKTIEKKAKVLGKMIDEDAKTAAIRALKEELVDTCTTDPVNTPLAYSAGMRGKYAVPEPVQEVVQVSPDDSANHPAHYDPVNHPPHYKEGGIEVIDFIEAKRLGYHLGNVIKYISRAYHKGGMEDLLKAQWYLNRAIEKGEV
jgi:hypothetical protein